LARVLLPQLLQPSMVMMIFFVAIRRKDKREKVLSDYSFGRLAAVIKPINKGKPTRNSAIKIQKIQK